MKAIPLTKGLFALVDDADFEFLNQWKWQCLKCKSAKYAVRNCRNKGTAAKKILMHRVLIDIKPGFFTDHIDGNGLNNQRSNLRVATRTQNGQNQKLRADNTTGFKGVILRKNGKFHAQITISRVKTHLGIFHTAQEAHEVYCNASRKYHGEFSRIA